MSYRAAHYSVRHRVIASLSALFRNTTYTVRHGPLRGLKRRGGLGFLPAWIPGANVQTAETAFFASLQLDGLTVYDIGGFEGLTALHFARKAARVIVYEPSPGNRANMEANLALNAVQNVTVRPVGVGSEPGRITLIADPLMPGGASGDSAISGQIRTGGTSVRTEVVPVVRLDDDIRGEGLPVPDFIKIDVEGMELAVIQGAAQTLRGHHPALYIELHGATPDEKTQNARAVVAALAGLGYGNIRHVETGATTDIPGEGHLYCRAAQ